MWFIVHNSFKYLVRDFNPSNEGQSAICPKLKFFCHVTTDNKNETAKNEFHNTLEFYM